MRKKEKRKNEISFFFYNQKKKKIKIILNIRKIKKKILNIK
jgi:hypothetical protein